MVSGGWAGTQPAGEGLTNGREGGEWSHRPELCDANGRARTPTGGVWGRGTGGYKTRGGSRAAAEGPKLWPGVEWLHYKDAGPGTGLCRKVSALA